LSAYWLLKKINADIYHSCEPSFGTYLAIKAMPHKKHVVTFRDPRDYHDWKMEYELPSYSRFQVIYNYIYENNILVRRSIKNMQAVYSIAKYLIPKIKSMYGLDSTPQFLPTPVLIPDTIKKADSPTVCYVARLDRRKRPELFLDLAEKFPHVKFIAMGKSRDNDWNEFLKKKYSNIPNIEMTGFIDQFSSDQHSNILEKSWIMVNTATREALPNSFLEAAAHKCAILSFVDPDGFASQFGYHAKDENFAEGLKFLLENQRWKELGEHGYDYVKKTFEMNRAIDLHVNAYEYVCKH
jgi:glycosyltransferase involved in cell wall biosynthesis